MTKKTMQADFGVTEKSLEHTNRFEEKADYSKKLKNEEKISNNEKTEAK